MESAGPTTGKVLYITWMNVSKAGSGPDTIVNVATYPAVPSLPVMVEIPLNVPLAKGGMVVCIRTFTASNGHRATSAMSSAVALAVR